MRDAATGEASEPDGAGGHPPRNAPPGGEGRWRERLAAPRVTGGLALASFVAVAVLVVSVTALLDPRTVAGQGIDLPGTIWIHWWVRTRLEAFALPLTTDLFFYPDGKNFFADTGANYLDALVGIPLQWAFGVPGFLDPLAVVVLVGNAVAFFALARDYTDGRRWPAWAASIAFLVNPFVLRQLGEGRPTQAMLWFVVLALRYGLRLGTGTRRDAVLFGVHTALAALTYWYNAYFIAFGLLPLALIELARAPRRALLRLGIAVGLTLLLTSPFLIGIARELASGAVRRLQYTNWGEGPAAAGSRWRIVAMDMGAATWLAAFGLGVAAWRRSWVLLLGVGVTLLMAVGGRLDLTDPMIYNWPLLYAWDHLPLFSRLGFPDRALAVTFVLLPLAAALGLARLDVVWAPLFALVAVGERLWGGDLPLVRTTYAEAPCAETVREAGGAVLLLPIGSSEFGMVTQTAHGQPLFGGMGEREPDLRPRGYEDRLHNSFVVMLGATLSDQQPAIGYTLADRQAIQKDFRWVWVDRKFLPPGWIAAGYNVDAQLRHLRRELGDPVFRSEECVLFDLSGPVPADAPGLAPGARLATDELDRLGVTNVDAETSAALAKPLTPPGGTWVPVTP